MKHRKLLSFVVALLMIVGTLAVIPVTASAENAWDGETVTQPAGKGTQAEPFLIASAENLAWISYMAKNYEELNNSNLIEGAAFNSTNVFEGVYFVQTADIDLGGHEFTPIGYRQSNVDARRHAFAGHYDGRSYKISNAVITPETSAIREINYANFMSQGFRPGGLFGVLAEFSSVSNINASNIKVGTLNTAVKNNLQAYDTLIAGVIVGTTYGNATVSGCTTDESCTAYGLFAAGGIIGMPVNGGTVTSCVNAATVGSDMVAGGIIGYGYNSAVSYCVNEGKVNLYTTTRWSAAGGIMGKPYAVTNTSVILSHCVNAANAKVEVVSLQPAGSSTNRIALGGIIGHDGQASQVNVSYLDCHNLQETFSAKFLDNGNTSQTYLAMAGAIAGNSKDVVGPGTRTMERCFSVNASLIEDIPGKGASTYACNFNQQKGEINPSAYAGLLGAALNDTQIGRAWSENIAQCFETCAYGVEASAIAAKASYQEIIAVANSLASYAEAPKYVGVQETLDRTAGNYELRFVLATNRTDYAEAGVEVTASYGDGQVAYFKLTADKYHDSLSGKKADGKGVNYTAASFGGEKLMALTQAIDLAAFGAVTYTVMPYFTETAGGEALYGRSWSLCYDADGSFVSHSIISAEEDDTAKFTIVYPDDSVNATVYPAVSLQYHVLSKSGIKLPLANASSSDPNAYEIVIVEDASMEAGAYKTEVEGNRLIVTAGDMFGFIAASNRLTKQLFIFGGIRLTEACNTTGVYTREMLTEKAAETRVIFQNAWFREDEKQFTESVTSYEYQLALVMNYLPDVIGLNEFREGWRLSGFINAMAENGYVELQHVNAVTGTVGLIDNPIFYNSETTEYIEGSAQYISYGTCKRVDTDFDGVSETILHNTGEFAGRYYDNTDDLVRTATVATFRDKETGDVYTVCCTHFESNGGVDPQVAPLGNPLRWEQVEKLLNFLDEYVAEYNAPVILGGDYNSKTSYPVGEYTAKGGSMSFSREDLFTFHDGRQIPYLYGAYEMLMDAGFYDMKTQTANTARNNSTQGYPIWNEELKAFVSFDAQLDGTSGGGIDHALAFDLENKIETVVYRYLEPETILTSSDHKPIMVDFNLTEGNGGNGGTDPNPNPEPPAAWQGMDDYTAPTKGNGTQDSPYLIETAQHLAWLSRAVEDVAMASEFLGTAQESRKVFSAVYFRQTADIDLNNQEFMPIGTYMGASSADRHLFGGQYDGNGYKIMNAKISMANHVGKSYYKNTAAATYTPPADPSVQGAAGHYDALFNVSAAAMLQNINAVNIQTGNYDAQHTQSTAAAVICGFIIEATIKNCTTDETCSATAAHAAGIVVSSYGGNGTKVSGCTNNATVTGTVAADGIWVHPLYETDEQKDNTNNGTVVKG